MKRLKLIPAMVAGAVATACAGLPIQDLSPASIGVDYSGTWRGEEITTQNVPAHESVHHVNVRYAPLPYLLLSAGIGGANYTVDTCNQIQFKGGFNFSPSLGIALFSPSLLNKKVRFTAGVKSHYMHTTNTDKSFVYSGPVVVPNAGLIFSLGEYVDMELGGRGLFLFGQMQEGSLPALSFSNADQKRIYFSVMLHTPAEGAYMMFDFDGSEGISMNWSDGPAESSFGISVGVILRQPKDRVSRELKEKADYPGYIEMEKKLDEMEKSMR
jgi:hypothetical protein